MSAKSEMILQELRAKNDFGVVSSIYTKKLPRQDWWRIISAAAKVAQPNDPFFEAAKKLAMHREQDQSFPFWPDGMYEIESSLPPISKEEVLAIFDKFLILEVDALKPGVQLYQLQWEVLTAYFRPLQEYYEGIFGLMNDGLISKPKGGEYSKYHSGLAWPLTINEAAIPKIRRVRWNAKHRRLRHCEQILADVWSSYPKLITLIAAILGGSIFLKLLEWVWGVLG